MQLTLVHKEEGYRLTVEVEEGVDTAADFEAVILDPTGNMHVIVKRDAFEIEAPATAGEIYHDNGRAFGRQTRFFRETAGGIEWMYGVDYASGSTRWYAFHPGVGQSIDELKRGGMFLSRLDNGNGNTA